MELIQAVLEEEGHGVVTATSATELPAGPFDCVVTDLLNVPAYTLDDARDWILRLGDRYPGVPVIVVTGHEHARRDAAALGARHVITKPFDVDRLTAAVREAITS